MPQNDISKMLVSDAAEHILQVSVRVEKIRAEMIKLAKQLPEFPAVRELYGVGDTIASKLMAEIGDPRRFASKRALAAYAGVDPSKNDSGKKVSTSGKISRTGDALLRKAVFQAVECYLLNSPADEPVYQFLDKKRSEGKKFYVYMTAACNKFLRIYYARVTEYMNELETAAEPETPAGAAENSTVGTTAGRIAAAVSGDNTVAYAQDRATQECDPSGDVGLSKPKGKAAARTA